MPRAQPSVQQALALVRPWAQRAPLARPPGLLWAQRVPVRPPGLLALLWAQRAPVRPGAQQELVLLWARQELVLSQAPPLRVQVLPVLRLQVLPQVPERPA